MVGKNLRVEQMFDLIISLCPKVVRASVNCTVFEKCFAYCYMKFCIFENVHSFRYEKNAGERENIADREREREREYRIQS